MNKLGIFVNFWEKTWDINYKYYIDKVQKLGYGILEFQAQPLLDMSNEECRAIKKYADERGIKLSTASVSTRNTTCQPRQGGARRRRGIPIRHCA